MGFHKLQCWEQWLLTRVYSTSRTKCFVPVLTTQGHVLYKRCLTEWSNNRVIRVFLWSAPDRIKHISQRVDRSPPKRRWLNFCYHVFTAVMVSLWNPDYHTHQVFTMSHNGGRHVLFFSAVVVVTIREHVVKVTDGKTLRNWRRAFPLHLMNPLHLKLYLPFSRDSSSAPGRVFINGAERGMNTRITVSVCSYLHPGPGGSLWNHI